MRCFEAAEGWGLDRRALFESLAGSAGATASGQSLLDRIAAGLREAGVDDVESVDDVRGVGGDAVAALDELLLATRCRTLRHRPVAHARRAPGRDWSH